jgi:uncharacterized membrane protein
VSEPGHPPLLRERRRGLISVAAGAVAVVALLAVRTWLAPLPDTDLAVLVLLVYLITYLIVTTVAFSSASPEEIRDWADREARGTVLQRYVLGTAPGPGVSLSISSVALAVAIVWMPGHVGGSFPTSVRIAVGVALVVVAWACVLVSFALTFLADNVVEDGRGLAFPGDRPGWSAYVYFAISVMTTFGTTDVEVRTDEMRRTVAGNAVIAFVFNTVTLASVVGLLVS